LIAQRRDSKREPVAIFDNGRITTINISQSFLKRVLYKGVERPDICPYQLYRTDITGQIQVPAGPSMMKGLYFEGQLLGRSAGMKVSDLPRKLRDGGKTVDQERIDSAIIQAQEVVEECEMVLNEETVQVKGQRCWVDPELYYQRNGLTVFIKCTADVISPFCCKSFGIAENLAVIDIKLTKDRDTDFINTSAPWTTFPWGIPSEMDPIQATLYSAVFELPFIFLIFDYRKENPGWKPVQVRTMHSHPNDPNARKQFQILKHSIRSGIDMLLSWNRSGWKAIPGRQCKQCVVENCAYYDKKESA